MYINQTWRIIEKMLGDATVTNLHATYTHVLALHARTHVSVNQSRQLQNLPHTAHCFPSPSPFDTFFSLFLRRCLIYNAPR